MAEKEIRRHITAVPFRPFMLNVSDGRRVPVHGRDFILISPLGSIVDVFQPDETHDILATGAITGITFDVPSAPPVQTPDMTQA